MTTLNPMSTLGTTALILKSDINDAWTYIASAGHYKTADLLAAMGAAKVEPLAEWERELLEAGNGVAMCGCDEADDNLKEALAERDDLKAKLAEAERSLTELAPAEALVEGTWFKVVELPRVLGNHMRSLDEAHGQLKESAIALEKARAERDEARVAVMKLIRIIDIEPES